MAYIRKGVLDATRQSMAALEWLGHLNHREEWDGRILHVMNGGEQMLRDVPTPSHRRGAKVDGYDPQTRTVFEFQGCLWHGCRTCFSPRDVNPVTGARMSDLRTRTLHKAEAIRRAGYTLVEMWGCEWTSAKEIDAELREETVAMELVEPIDPRDAFFGGRCECTRTFVQVTRDPESGAKISDCNCVLSKALEGESWDEECAHAQADGLYYYDFKSLYPFCNKNESPLPDAYPTGHPIVHSHVDGDLGTDLSPYYGIAKVDILPPEEFLYHPVLPSRHHGKLMFVLCRTCAEEKRTDRYCDHGDAARKLRGTWVTEEIKLAVLYGYRVLKVFEVWHFEETTRALFASYVKKFQKIKEQCEGWPQWADTEPKRLEYLRAYQAREGVTLDPGSIAKNSPLRKEAKATLNCLWGKTGQKPNKVKTKYVSDLDEWVSLATDAFTDIHRVFPIGDHSLQVMHSVREEFTDLVKDDKVCAVVVALWTTYLARKHLYTQCLAPLGSRVAYMDTDSVIFQKFTTDADTIVKTGYFFGELTDELPPGVRMTEFVGAGPKNYGYQQSDGEACVKVRGLRLNYRASQIVHKERVKEIVFAMVQDVVHGDSVETAGANASVPVAYPNAIVPKQPKGHDTKVLRAQTMTKKYAPVMSKRVLVAALVASGAAHESHYDIFDTVPFGTRRPSDLE